MSQERIPQQPYLLRALHDWISDNGNTPYLIVDATVPGVSVPEDYVDSGRITLNISHAAVHGLDMGNEQVEFEARFAGRPFHVCLPIAAVRGSYARETGRGMIFAAGDSPGSESGRDNGDDDRPDPPGRPQLKVIK